MKLCYLFCFIFFIASESSNSKEIELEILQAKRGDYEIKVINNYKCIKFDPYESLRLLHFYKYGEIVPITLFYGFTEPNTHSIYKRKTLKLPIDLKLILKYIFSTSLYEQFKGKYEVKMVYRIRGKLHETKSFYIFVKTHKDFKIQLKK